MSGAPLRVQVPMRWGDMDAYGHVNNIAVVQLLEEARVAAFGVPASARPDRPGPLRTARPAPAAARSRHGASADVLTS